MRDKLSRLSVYVRDVRDVRDVFLFHYIYNYGRKFPMKSRIFVTYRGEATNFRGEATNFREESSNSSLGSLLARYLISKYLN